jgi:gamma-glutamyl-gamma-aminobutyrate hydrolase PuuD
MMKKIYIVGPSFYDYFHKMFSARGYEIVENIESCDIVQFTGGEDVAPALYGEHTHPRTYFSKARDKKELEVYKKAQELGKFCAGVCRGGQLLNVLSGGSMYQDVQGHGGMGGHDAIDVQTGKVFNVTSVHHQMMKLGNKGVLLAKSTEMLSRVKMGMSSFTTPAEEIKVAGDDVEVEACYYPETRSFCYQPHPEFANEGSECRNWYFDKLEELYANTTKA